MSAIDILPMEYPVDEHYGDIRTHLNQMGCPIGWNDLFIASHARSLGLILVTDNIREFSRVPGLTVVNWIDRTPDTRHYSKTRSMSFPVPSKD
jgi:tRNA(fMet)-specific endonuclease VapC